MVSYSCEKCGKEFSQKGHYTRHLNKKNPCVVESKIKEMLDKVVEENLLLTWVFCICFVTGLVIFWLLEEDWVPEICISWEDRTLSLVVEE